MPTEPLEPVVRIRPAFWSPRVWPVLLLTIVVSTALGTGLAWEFLPADTFVLVIAGAFWAALAWRMWTPVFVLHPDRIEFRSWTEDDDYELGPLWFRGRRTSKAIVLSTSRLGGWLQEGLRVRLRFPDPLSPSLRFSLAGIYARDRERILAWLRDRLGG